MATVKLYKTIDENLLKAISISENHCFFYINDNKDKIMLEEDSSQLSKSRNSFLLVDSINEWEYPSMPLYLDFELAIKNIHYLFESTGVCSKDGVLGIALEWKSSKSKLKHCLKLGEVNVSSKEFSIKVNKLEIPEAFGTISFKCFIYIIDPGKLSNDRSFGREKGLILGEKELWCAINEGSGGLFPIVNVTEGPLWDYMVNIDDIEIDPFDEEVCPIFLNINHPLYVSLIEENQNMGFLYEIISSALTLMIIDIRNNLDEGVIDLSREYYSGSVLQTLKYFSDALGFNINGTYQELHESIKRFFDERGFRI